jgi:carbamoyl-phosphate synthase large subunit
MPRRTDFHKILVIGSGPIVIGQACEFDYSGTQAIKALREEGFEVILVNSNPATIMTDPELAERTYIEPIVPDVVEQIIAKERPDAILPTLGGQTALNTAVSLAKSGVLDRYNVKLIGASLAAIETAEDRQLFRDCVHRIGLQTPKSGVAHNLEEAWRIAREVGFPAILRPAFTLGGSGGAIAYNQQEFPELILYALSQSPVSQVLIEESVLGWKEFELEVMRDHADNVVIICSIENFDPMGVHTGDSITVAPAMTLTDKEYQRMRDAAIAIIRAVGVDTGGSNVQFGVNPEDGRLVVIEMNPRVSRSSALASKATGFPIARIAAKLAVGYTLDELPNEITKKTKAAFEPVLDYVVVKIPRFAFEKFPNTDTTLTTQMKSVGEVMAMGRSFAEALQKAMRGLENKRDGFVSLLSEQLEPEELFPKLGIPGPDRLWHIADAFRVGMSLADVSQRSRIDPWFLEQIRRIVSFEGTLAGRGVPSAAVLRRAKEMGFADSRIAALAGVQPKEIEAKRIEEKILPVMKRVDTCAAEFVAHTPYFYSTYDEEDETNPTQKQKIMILGCGPNRIGQGIEFDYCCVHGALALREEGFETIMVNCNPETVSTDFDISDRLYFEPLTHENVLEIIRAEGSQVKLLVQFGGQTPLQLASGLAAAGVSIIGTSPDAIDRAEDRERFSQVLQELNLQSPAHGTANTIEEARDVARRLGYPVLVRPSYVLGGRAMEIVYEEKQFNAIAARALEASNGKPLLLDAFLRDATEVDVDAISDGDETLLCGIMEHVEEAGVHSGDSSCCLPPYSLDDKMIKEIEVATKSLARGLGVIGLMNVQFAIRGDQLYVLEVNPRASRTIPFVSKATGIPWAKLAAKVMVGKKLSALLQSARPSGSGVAHYAVKSPVFPFVKFSGVDSLLGPEMRSTGEVMGIASDFWSAFAKAQLASGTKLPRGGNVFLSVKDDNKGAAVDIARRLSKLGFHLVATRGTARFLRQVGVQAESVNKVREGRPHIVDRLISKEIHLVINTTLGTLSTGDSKQIRRQALLLGIPYFTRIESAFAAVGAIERLHEAGQLPVQSMQEYFPPKS